MEEEAKKSNFSETPVEKADAVQKIDWSTFDPKKRDIYIENQQRENNALAGFQSVLDTASTKVNPYLKFQQHGVNYGASNRGGVNLERYYNRDEFKTLGFNPFGDNESYYQANTDFWDDFRVARQQFTSLFKLGIWSYFSDEDQYTKAERYARAANIGTSQRENAFSRNFNNLVLNSGYTLGLMTGILLEEVPLFFLTGGSGNLVKAPKTAFTIGKITKLADTAKDVGHSIKAVRDVQKVSNARQFWQGAGNVASELVPFKTTGDLLLNWKRIGTATDKGTELLDTGAKLQRLFGSFYRDGREILLAYDESKLESGMIYNDMMDEMILDFQTKEGRLPDEKELSDLSRIAKEQENRTFIKNMGAIYLTNRISFGNAFNRMNPRLIRQGSKTIYQNSAGKIKADLSNNKVKAVMKEGFLNVNGARKEFFNNVRNIRHTWKPGLMYLGKGSLRYTRANFGEGIQEWIQETVQEAEKITGMEAYEKYKQGLRGAALDDALGSADFFQNYGKAASHFWSAEGFEIFGSGFLMGGVAGPYMATVSRVPNVLSQMSEYATKESREKRLETMKTSRKILEAKVEQFNKLTDKEQEHIYNYILQAGRQASYKQQMDDAEEEGNDKMFYDVKDKALGDYIINALSSGTYDLFIAQLKDMLELSDTEFAEAFKEQLNFENVEELQGLKARAQDIIESAENIRNLYDQVNNIFPEFIDVTDQDEEFYGDLSLRDLKAVRDQYIQQVVLHQYQLDRNLQRTQKLLNSLSGENSPFRDISNIGTASVAPLLSSQIMDNELQRLQDEIKTLKEIIKSDKEFGTPTKTKEKELNIAQNKLERLSSIDEAIQSFVSLVKYSNLLEEQRRILKSENPQLIEGQKIRIKEETTDEDILAKVIKVTVKNKVPVLTMEYTSEGEKKTVEIEATDKLIETLNTNFGNNLDMVVEAVDTEIREYLFQVAKEGNTTIDQAKIENFIKAWTDAKILKAEEFDLADVILTLTSPGVYADYMSKAIQQRKKLGKLMKASVKRDLEQYYKTAEKNLLVQTLVQKHNAFLRANDLANILDDGMGATYKAFDVNTLEEILPGTERFLAIDAEIVEFIKNSKEAAEETEEARTQEEEEQVVTEEEEVEFELSLENVLADLPKLERLPKEFKTILQSKIDAINQTLQEKIDGVEGEELKEVFRAQKKSIETLTSEDSQLINESIKAYQDSLKAKPAEEKKEKADTVKKDEPKTPVTRHPGMAPHLSQTTPVFSGQEEELVEKLSNTLDILAAGVTEERADGTEVSYFFNLDPLRFDNYTKFPYLFDNYLYDNLLGNARLLLTQEEFIKVFNRIPTETPSIVFALNGYNLFGTVSTTAQVINSSDLSAFESYGYPQEKVEGTYEVEMTFDGKTYYVESEEIKAFWEEGSALYKVELYAASEELLRALNVTETSEQDVVNEELLSYIDTNLTLDNVEEVKTYVETELAKNGMTADSATYMEYVDSVLENLKSDITIDNFIVGEGLYMRGSSNPNTYRVISINKKTKSVTFEPIDEDKKKGKKMTVQEKDLSEMRKVDPADIQVPEQEAMSEDAQEKLEGTKASFERLTAEEVRNALVTDVSDDVDLDDLFNNLEETC